MLIISTFWIKLPLPLGVVGHEGSTVLVVDDGSTDGGAETLAGLPVTVLRHVV